MSPDVGWHERLHRNMGTGMTGRLAGHEIQVLDFYPDKIVLRIAGIEFEVDDTLEICGARWLFQCLVTDIILSNGRQILRARSTRFLDDPTRSRISKK